LQGQNPDLAFSTAWEQLVRSSSFVLLYSDFASRIQLSDALFYDVYTRLSDLHLADIGVDVEWSDVDVTETNKDRWGETREYFTMPIYRLPEGRMRAM
jgi:protein arginine N-methyltransferase 2